MSVTRCPTRLLGLVLVLASGCASEPEARAQLVLVVDTNAPVPEQVEREPGLSAQAAVDTALIDVLDEDGNVVDTRTFVVTRAVDWPLTFGIVPDPDDDATSVSVRVRVFSGALSRSVAAPHGFLLEPFAGTAIDRLVAVTLPVAGVFTAVVVADAACRGLPTDFLARRTCISAETLEGAVTDGIEWVSEVKESQVGTFRLARAEDCQRVARSGQICIPGGFSLAGDPVLTGVADGQYSDSVPLRPVTLSPFFMDETELSVGRLRALVAAGKVPDDLPALRVVDDPVLGSCTWQGSATDVADSLPVSCVTWDAARTICEAAGGSLPTETQWEHAARGRGEARAYPWGNVDPDCCTASISRRTPTNGGGACPGLGPGPVGSHLASDECVGDVSRDGVLDLGGSVAELTLDSFRDFDAPCWGTGGVQSDPLCTDGSTTSVTQRGASFSEGFLNSRSALRRRALPSLSDPNVGFRCVYEDTP